MANVRYKISNRIEDDGRSEIYIRFPLSRSKYIQIRTGIKVNPAWFVVTGESGGNKVGDIQVPRRGRLNTKEVQEAASAKEELQDMTMRLQRLFAVMGGEMFADKERVSQTLRKTAGMAVQDITRKAVEEMEQEHECAKDIWSCCELYLKDKQFSDTRERAFRVLMRDLHRWEAWRQRIGDDFALDINSITPDDIDDLRDYISNEFTLALDHPKVFEEIFASYPPEQRPQRLHNILEERGENTTKKILKNLKSFWNWMNDKRITKNKPFEGITIGSAIYGTPFYLTIEERNAVADYDLSARPQLAIQRDIFIFQCLTGCRVGDLYKLTSENITNGVLEYVPHKTKDEQVQVKPRVPLTARARSIVEKYKGADASGRLFPFISVQKYNDAIKDVLRACAITRNVIVRNSVTGESEIKMICDVASSHMARRTFVGAAYSKVRDPNIVGKMSGHVEGSRAFARYRTIDDDLLKDVMEQIE